MLTHATSIRSCHLLKSAAIFLCSICALTKMAIAQLDDVLGPLPHVSFEAVPPTPWFSHPAVKQELNWHEETHRKVVTSYGDQFAQYTKSIASLPQDLTPTQRRQRERELMQNFHAQLQTSLDQSLRDEAGRARYAQLHLQYQGNSVVHNPQVQERLKITKDQRALLLKEDREWNQALENYWKKHKTDPSAAKKEFEAARAKLGERMTNTLDSPQLEAWKAMTGKPYQFPAEAYLRTSPDKKPAKSDTVQ